MAPRSPKNPAKAQVKILKSRPDSFNVELNLSRGELLSVLNALANYRFHSAPADDTYHYVVYAMAKNPEIKDLQPFCIASRVQDLENPIKQHTVLAEVKEKGAEQ